MPLFINYSLYISGHGPAVTQSENVSIVSYKRNEAHPSAKGPWEKTVVVHDAQGKPLVGKTFILHDSHGKPLLVIDPMHSGRLVNPSFTYDHDNPNISHIRQESFVKLLQCIGDVDVENTHYMESLGRGKQKICTFCKILGIKTTEAGVPVKTRVKCSSCDIPLCRGFPRFCFKTVHQILQMMSYPDLKYDLFYKSYVNVP